MRDKNKHFFENLSQFYLEIERVLNKNKGSLEDKCYKLLKLMDEIIPNSGKGIFLIDEETNEVGLLAAKDYSKEAVTKIYEPGKGMIGTAVQEKKTIYIPDLDKIEKRKVKPIYVDAYPNIKSALVIPIKYEQNIYGVLEIVSKKKNAFSQDLINIAKAIAYGLAPQIEIIKMIKNRHFEFGHKLYSFLEDKHPYLKGHANRVAAKSREIARGLGLEEKIVKKIELAAKWHDIGKIKIRDDLLDSQKIFDKQNNPIKSHAEEGYSLLLDYGANPAQDKVLLNVVRLHHEDYNGAGYPLRLKKDEIPLEAAIVHLIDVFDALTSPRPYRESRGQPVKYNYEEAINIIKETKELFHPKVLEVFCEQVYPKIKAENKNL